MSFPVSRERPPRARRAALRIPFPGVDFRPAGRRPDTDA